MSKWIQKGDKVLVISGNHKGKIGQVLARIPGKYRGNEARKWAKLSDAEKAKKQWVLDRLEDRVIVQGVNVQKRHKRKTSREQAGKIAEQEGPITISNVSLCNAEGRPVRLRARIVEGTKELYYKVGQEEVVHRKIKITV
jgi:large subunit ribosomal protein L24